MAMFFNYRVLFCPQNEHTGGFKKAKPRPPLESRFFFAKEFFVFGPDKNRDSKGGRGFCLFKPHSMLVLRTQKDAVIKKHGHIKSRAFCYYFPRESPAFFCI